MEVVLSPNPKDLGVLLLSAGGKNPDILGAFRKVVAREPRTVSVLCFEPTSPLVALASQYDRVDVIAPSIPGGRDGFLAVNSLLAFCVLLARAYRKAFSLPDELPDDFADLNGLSQFESTSLTPLWDRDTIVFLHGIDSAPAAIDFESKFTEAALGNVQISDYRNFAHGRHHWLAKRSSSTAILAAVTNSDRDIAERMLNLIPNTVPIVRYDVPESGISAVLSSLVFVLKIVAVVGEAKGIDPGRPGVPAFGRKIYHLSVLGEQGPPGKLLSPEATIAIERKTSCNLETVVRRGELDFWRDAYEAFNQKITTTLFGSAIFDYDGTLCDERERFSGVGTAVTSELVRILKNGLPIGIATGRGKSVRLDLRSKIPQEHWDDVLIGYYNASDIGRLSDELPVISEPSPDLRDIADALASDFQLARSTQISLRRMQITVEPLGGTSDLFIWDRIQQLLQESRIPGLTALRSAHSIDILAPGVSKRSLVKQVAVSQGPTICVGDRGRWPGNDFAFLSEPYSLSVDEVSLDPATCWNLAPAGHQGIQAALDYLRWLQPASSRRMQFRPKSPGQTRGGGRELSRNPASRPHAR
jgi:hypothetical protein